jgi:hypothetical protein
MDGEAYLRRLAQIYIDEASGGSGDRGVLAAMRLGELAAAGRALVAAGLLEAEHLRELAAEFKQMFVDAGFIERIHGGTSLSVSERVEFTGPSTTRRGEANAGDPVRVVPIVREVAIPGRRGRLVFMCLELWSTHFYLRYATAGDDFSVRDRPRRMQPLMWEVVDDAGSPYRPRGGGAHGGAWVSHQQSFSPAIPPEATRLTFIATDFDSDEELVRLTVDL